jgi:hypothetical protein
MKIKYLAVTLAAFTFSQATFASAPLCRSVLRSFTQEQIQATVDDFARLTLQADQAKVSGQKDALSRSLQVSQRLKEKEILQSLNISREDLRKLVSERSAILQKRDTTETQSRERTSAKEAVLRKEFIQVKHFEPNFAVGIWQFKLVVNGTKLLGSGTNKELLSLEDGTKTSLFGQGNLALPDALFTSETSKFGKDELTVTNLHNGTQIKHDSFPQPFSMMAASDNQSVVKSKNIMSKAFEYQHVDKNGVLLSSGSVRELHSATLQHIGTHVWLFRMSDNSQVLFNPLTKDITPLNILGTTVSNLHNNKISIQDVNILHTVDLTAGQVFSKDLGEKVDISFSDGKFIWIIKASPTNKYHNELRKIDINTQEEVPGFVIPIGYLLAQSQTTSNLIALMSRDRGGSPNHIKSGIYRMEDLETPIFNTSEVYGNKSIVIQDQLLSEDGNTLVIVGTNDQLTGEKFFVDVWKVK